MVLNDIQSKREDIGSVSVFFGFLEVTRSGGSNGNRAYKEIFPWSGTFQIENNTIRHI
jgi:hypothetical protein